MLHSRGSMAAEPRVSIVIPAFNKWAFTSRCLLSLLENTPGTAHEIIVVDNASTDGTQAGMRSLPELRYHRNEQNLGFAKACNQGAALARGRHVLFLNNDTEARDGWLEPMVRIADADPTVGAVGAKLLFPDGSIQHAGVALVYGCPVPVSSWHMHYRKPGWEGAEQLDLSAVTGACLLVPRRLFLELGGFDEAYRNGYEDVDLCLQLRERGYRVVYTPQSVLIHHESISAGRHDRETDNLRLFNRRWIGRLRRFDVDPRLLQQGSPPRPGRPAVSLVVATQNALGGVATCLDAFALQLGGDDELLLADAASIDGSAEFARAFARCNPAGRRCLADAGQTLEAAVRAGLAAARQPFAVVAIQAVRPAPRYLDEATAALAAQPGAHVIASATATGLCAAGSTAVLQAVAAQAPGALLGSDPRSLKRELDRLGAGLTFVGPDPSASPRSPANGSPHMAAP